MPNGWVAKTYILCLGSCSIHHTQNPTTQNTSSHMQNLIISWVAHQSPFGRGSYQQSTYRIVPTANLQDYTSQLTGLYQQSTYRIVPTVNLQDYTSQLTGLYQQPTNRIIPVNLQDCTNSQLIGLYQSTYRILPNSQLTGLYQQSTSYRKHQLSFDLHLIHSLENVHWHCLLSLTSSHLSVVTSATTSINQSNHRSAEI